MTISTLALAVSLTVVGQVAAEEPVATNAEAPVVAEVGSPESYLPPPEERDPVERTLRGFHEYSEELQAWFKQEATAEKESEQIEAIVALCAMYHELRTDPRYPTSDALQRMKIKIWSRLTKVKRELEVKQAREAEALADTASETQAVSGDAAQLVALANSTPANAFGGGPRRGDFGDDLVNLIERTIAPTKWDVNGGPFTIVYYAPLHALVVRASSEVHGRMGGLLVGLRQAGN